jgi:ABC-type lipoprotein release transport system permease subunit
MNIIGNKFSVDFGMAKAILNIQSETSLTYTTTEKNGKEVQETETVKTQMTEVSPQLYMITWKEKNGNMITQIQDYENGIIYSNWASLNGEFTHSKGTLKQV